MAEQGVKPLDDRGWQGRTEDRGDVLLDVSLVAGPEENDIGALLVACVAIGGIGDAFGGAVGHEEPERIAIGRDRTVELTLLDQLGEDVATIGGVAEYVADDEHQQR